MTWTSVAYSGSCTVYHVLLVTGQLLVKHDSMCIIRGAADK